MLTGKNARYVLWLVVTAMSIVLLITIASCGGSGDNNGPSGDQSLQPTTVGGSPPPPPPATAIPTAAPTNTPTGDASGDLQPPLSLDPESLLGSSGTIDNVIRPALEDALNVELKLDDTFEMTPAGGYTVIFNYLVEGELPSDPLSAFAEAIGGLGGFGGGPGETRGGVVSVNYRGISIDDVAFFVGLTLEGKELGAVVSAMR